GKCCFLVRQCHDDRHLTADQVGRQFRQSIVVITRPTIFERDVAALDKAGFVEGLAERIDKVLVGIRRSAAEMSDYRHDPKLAASEQRPGRSNAEPCDELPSNHERCPPVGYVPVHRKQKLAQSGEVGRPELFRLTSAAEMSLPADSVEKVSKHR